MARKPFSDCSIFHKSLIMLSLAISLSGTAFAQEMSYSFNQPGSACYFNYVCYSQSNTYNSIKQPFIFIMGKPGESADDTYRQDTLKDLSAFYNYLFVYIPNRGSTAASKLYCIDALASLLTSNFTYGHANLFLNINDPIIVTFRSCLTNRKLSKAT